VYLCLYLWRGMGGRMLSIEIFSDVICPWCFIGKRRMDNALAL
jgi:predicted DsbA family dithiol-disulfide isomerase